jgi:hypothetical protein
MAKPICVIYYNPEINGSPINNAQFNINMGNIMTDYHVFCIPSYMSIDGNCELIEFKVFHEKDFTEIQYEELKKIIIENLNK